MIALIAQMIGFVGDSPAEWQPKWHEIQVASNFVPVKGMSPFERMVCSPREVKAARGRRPFFDPADLRVDESHLSKLELTSHEKVPEEDLKLLLRVVQESFHAIGANLSITSAWSHRESATQVGGQGRLKWLLISLSNSDFVSGVPMPALLTLVPRFGGQPYRKLITAYPSHRPRSFSSIS